ncbi:hypothetical protein [Mucilaginibacter ginsenosidivorans]|uniref:Uncharacterized protein n=1 Tax=Mucilaginibacter ginsenosidivorans TaxID=398053 RepID=A0A5B8UW65_9SPHI|nr:hypothetical protein [Mucilaginibacter ginsenosidivorans]QEC63148.1 hypothetical protein FRZ54_11360 [Mucilaginibacter ginsenosidivorans]
METLLNVPDLAEKARDKMPLCPKCKVELGYRVRRGFVFKQLLNWLPVKRYYCYKCKRRHYIWN